MPKHVLPTIAVALALFVLIWFGIFVLGQTANEALFVSTVTVTMLGIGVAYTRSSVRRDRNED